MSYCLILEVYLPFVLRNAANNKGVYNFAFVGPNSAVISDSCDYIGTQIYVLVELCFPYIFKYDPVPFIICVFSSIAISLYISLIN